MAELAKMYKPSEVEPEILQRWNQAQAFHAEPSAPGSAIPGAGAGAKPYCIVIPPPNVTAALHMGHALNNTLQDILIRWRRMVGDNTVWIPGTDHAGIATQTVVEKRVLAEQGKRRTDFEREAFVKLIQAWKDEYEATITNQLKTMGCSCDWQRQRFTMDEVCAQAVREAFFQLFQAGLIYRGKRLVNWDPATQTALADDEVEMEEVDGQFYYLKYPLADGSGHVTVATTRPETMLGDTAVAINPKDPRAPGTRSKKVRLPIVNRVVPIIEDEYVVLPDPDSDDAKARYATGFLKVTPAHDDNDYLIGQRHHLPIINILSPAAAVSKDHGWPAEDFRGGDEEVLGDLLGKDRFEAREIVVEWFRENGLLEEVKPYRHSVGHSYRSHVPIEPYLSDQWYVDVDKDFAPGSPKHPCLDPRGGHVDGSNIPRNSLAGLALRAMAIEQRSGTFADLSKEPAKTEANSSWTGGLRIIPDRYARPFQAWHENIRDWCISRQLWWGHRIPVWSQDLALPSEVKPTPTDRGPDAQICAAIDRAAGGPFSQTVRRDFPDVHYHMVIPREQPAPGTIRTYICVREDHPAFAAWLDAHGWRQDPDVLDTWFSSALWPISTLGWPGNTPELQTWNPSNTLCTAREILTLWVSRMVMFNLYFRGCLPFSDVFVHAMIQDGEGRKMSKSLGNGVDPLDIIASHGSDAMRFTLAQMTTLTQDVRMPVERDPASGRNTSPKFDAGRNFSNKIWNAVRFALTNLEQADHKAHGQTSVGEGFGLPERWILSRLARLVHDTDAALANYEFSDYAQGLYDFLWRDLCDWYIEAVKPTLKDSAVQRGTLAAALDVSLRLLQPVMPFISEKLWEHLNWVAPDRSAPTKGVPGVEIPPSALLIRARWPKLAMTLIDPPAEEEFTLVQQLVSSIRQVRTTYKVPPRQTVQLTAKAPAPLAARAVERGLLIETLANVQVGEIGPRVDKPGDAAATTVGEVELYLHGLVQADAERQRLSKRREELARSIKTLEGRLANQSYTEKAPAHLVQQTRDQLAAGQKELATVEQQIAGL